MYYLKYWRPFLWAVQNKVKVIWKLMCPDSTLQMDKYPEITQKARFSASQKTYLEISAPLRNFSMWQKGVSWLNQCKIYEIWTPTKINDFSSNKVLSKYRKELWFSGLFGKKCIEKLSNGNQTLVCGRLESFNSNLPHLPKNQENLPNKWQDIELWTNYRLQKVTVKNCLRIFHCLPLKRFRSARLRITEEKMTHHSGSFEFGECFVLVGIVREYFLDRVQSLPLLVEFFEFVPEMFQPSHCLQGFDVGHPWTLRLKTIPQLRHVDNKVLKQKNPFLAIFFYFQRF